MRSLDTTSDWAGNKANMLLWRFCDLSVRLLASVTSAAVGSSNDSISASGCEFFRSAVLTVQPAANDDAPFTATVNCTHPTTQPNVIILSQKYTKLKKPFLINYVLLRRSFLPNTAWKCLVPLSMYYSHFICLQKSAEKTGSFCEILLKLANFFCKIPQEMPFDSLASFIVFLIWWFCTLYFLFGTNHSKSMIFGKPPNFEKLPMKEDFALRNYLPKKTFWNIRDL